MTIISSPPMLHCWYRFTHRRFLSTVCFALFAPSISELSPSAPPEHDKASPAWSPPREFGPSSLLVRTKRHSTFLCHLDIMTRRSRVEGQKRRASSPLESSRDKRGKPESSIVCYSVEVRIPKLRLTHEASGRRQPRHTGKFIDLSKYRSRSRYSMGQTLPY